MDQDFRADVDAIGRLTSVPTILEVVCRTTGMGFAAVARVTADRWIACSVRDEIEFGLTPGGELKVETTICNEIRESGNPVVINHVAEDDAWRNHRTPALYGFQSYISVPIVLQDGTFFGTLCAIDPKPFQLDKPEIIGMFKLFAGLIALHLDNNERLATSDAILLDERKASELREQFIAVLGHDLRNPLAAISAGTRLLLRESQSEKARSVVSMMQDSVTRMARLIDNILDFARGRLGGGWVLNRADTDLAPVLGQVIGELMVGSPDRRIETRVALTEPVNCDGARIGQLLSNLLGNALTHGAKDGVIVVSAVAANGNFALSVCNAGMEIPAAARAHLFEPFVRGSADSNQQGLGLGLYIASQIAKAHNGTLNVTSSPEETVFTFQMPLH